MKNKSLFSFNLFLFCLLLNPAGLWCGEQEDWDFANGLYVREIYDLAQKEYRRYIDSYPQSTQINDAYYRIAESFWHLKSYESALPFYQKLKRESIQSPKNEVIRIREALCYNRTGNTEKARTLLKEFEESFPESEFIPSVYYLLAKTADEAGNAEEAVMYYDKAIERGDKNARLSLYRKGHLYIRTERFEEALETFLILLESKGNDQMDEDALFKAGELCFQLKRFKEAYTYYESYLKKYPKTQKALDAYRNVFYTLALLKDISLMKQFYNANKATLDFSKESDFSLFMLAKTAFEIKDYSMASLFLKELKEHSAGNRYFVRSVILEARIAFSERKYNEAFNILSSVHGKELAKEDISEIYFIKGESLKNIGHIQEALDFFSKIIQIKAHQPVLTKSYFEKANCLYRLGQYEEAAHVMQDFLKNEVDRSVSDKACLKLAEYLSYSGKLEEAVLKLKEYVGLYPDSQIIPDAYYRISINLMKMGQYDEMSKSLYELIAKTPEENPYYSKALYWIGWNHLRQGQYVEAKKRLVEIYDKHKGAEMFSESVYWLGVACYSMKETDEALYYFIELLESSEKKVFSELMLFWLTDELIKREDLVHAETAVAWLKEKVETSESVQRADYMEIAIYFGKKEFHKARLLAEAFLEKYPASDLQMDVELKRAHALIEEREFELAKKKIEELSESDNVDASFRAFFLKAMLFEKQDLKEEAAREYLRLAILYDHPMSSDAAYKAYFIYQELGQDDFAEKSRKEILQRWPDSDEAKRLKDE